MLKTAFQSTSSYGRSTLILLSLVSTILVAILMIPKIGGIDFFYFINVSRDLALHPELKTEHYFYFPGIQLFWKWVIQGVGDNLLSIQIIYAACLFLNAALIVGIVHKCTRSSFSILACPIYYFFLFYLDGFEGGAEPIATLILLLSLYISFYCRFSAIEIITLSAGFALMIFIKQPGILLLPALFFYSYLRHKTFGAGLSTIWFSITLCLLFLLEGGSLDRLWAGLFSIPNYGVKGQFLSNFLFVHLRYPLFFCFFLFASGLYIKNTFENKKMKDLLVSLDNKSQVFYFFLVTVFCSFIQYRMRGFYHYELYALPGIIICIAIALPTFIQKIKLLATGKAKTILSIGAIALLAIASVAQDRRVLLLHFDDHWRYARVAEGRYRELCPRLERGALMLIPSRENAIHFFCKTWTATPQYSYSWAEESTDVFASIILNQTPQQVLVFKENFGGFENSVLGGGKRKIIESALATKSYRLIYETDYGQLYKHD